MLANFDDGMLQGPVRLQLSVYSTGVPENGEVRVYSFHHG
jgi:hypothetical protein